MPCPCEVLLRPPKEILRVVETFEEARALLGPLSEREIGGICLKGVASGVSLRSWAVSSELRQFAHNATAATKGSLFGEFDLNLRRLPLTNAAATQGKITVFNDDIEMHFDGYFTDTVTETGSVETSYWKPLIGREFYQGVSHHLTSRGSTTMVMDRLSSHRVTQLARNFKRIDLGVVDTRPLKYPTKGEAVELESGDYLAFHSYAVHKMPVYAHGTTGSSPDRRSITYTPVSIEPGIVDAWEPVIRQTAMDLVTNS